MSDEKKQLGRPPIYDDRFHPFVLKGMFFDNPSTTVAQICERFDIVESTFYKWVVDHPIFSEAWSACRAGLRNILISGGIREALGYWEQKEVYTKEGVVTLNEWHRGNPSMFGLMASNLGIIKKEEPVQVNVSSSEQDIMKAILEGAKNTLKGDEYNAFLIALKTVTSASKND